MTLVDSSEKKGNFLFKYRGQFPILLFLIALPLLYFFPINISNNLKLICNILSMTVCLFGFLIRFYTIGTTLKGTSGRNTKKQIADNLNSRGIYSIVRHPLYLANYFIWIGITIFTYNIYFFLIVNFLFWAYYKRIIFTENRFLEKKFGGKYLDWAKRIPSFIPSFKNYKRTAIRFSIKSILRREYSGMLAAVVSFAYIDILKIFLDTKNYKEYYLIETLNFQITPLMLYILIVTLIISLVLKLLKSYTSILNEEDRS